MLEHSFSRMTWCASTRQYVEGVFGIWIGLTAKERNRIRAANGVPRWELRCLSQYVNSKDNQITWRKQMNRDEYWIPWERGWSYPFIGVW